MICLSAYRLTLLKPPVACIAQPSALVCTTVYHHNIHVNKIAKVTEGNVQDCVGGGSIIVQGNVLRGSVQEPFPCIGLVIWPF